MERSTSDYGADMSEHSPTSQRIQDSKPGGLHENTGTPTNSARSLIDTSKLQNQKFTRATTKSGRPAGLLPKLRMSWREGVIEHVIGDAAAKGDSLRFVKGPMNAKINSTLAVLFLGFREGRKTARPIRPEISIVVASLPVELVGNERERDVIGAVEAAHDLEECPSKSGMTRRVCGERRSKVRPVEIAGRRA